MKNYKSKKIRVNMDEEDLEILNKYNLSASLVLKKICRIIRDEGKININETTFAINFQDSFLA